MARLNQSVQITGGMSEFVGKRGVIVDDTDRDGRAVMYRVRLDEPVEVPGVGTVTSDLWVGSLLRTLRR